MLALGMNQPSYLTKTDFTASSIYVPRAATCLSSKNKSARSHWACITSTSYLKHYFAHSASAPTSVMQRKNLCYFGKLFQ